MKRNLIIILSTALIMLQCKLSAQDSFIYKMQGDKLFLHEDSVSVVISFKSEEYTIDSTEITPSFGICTPEGVNTRICNPKNNFPFVLIYNLQLNLSNHYRFLIL